MKVILIAVTSLDGKLTQGSDSDIYKWTSKEDQDFFFERIKNAKVIVMGSSTYEAVRDNLNFDKKNRLRIVLTKNPEKYKNEKKDGLLEFSSESPVQLINRLYNYEEVLLVGGSKIYSSFLKENLVDEIYLTIEPIIFGDGKTLFDKDLNVKLNLTSYKLLNKNGTILLKYSLKNN